MNDIESAKNMARSLGITLYYNKITGEIRQHGSAGCDIVEVKPSKSDKPIYYENEINQKK